MAPMGPLEHLAALGEQQPLAAKVTLVGGTNGWHCGGAPVCQETKSATLERA